MSSELDNIMEQALDVKKKMDIALLDSVTYCWECQAITAGFRLCDKCEASADNAGEL